MAYVTSDGTEHKTFKEAVLQSLQNGREKSFLSTEEALVHLFSLLVDRGVLSLEDVGDCLYTSTKWQD